MEKLIPDDKPADKHDEQYYRRKIQAWCKILGNRQRLEHRERFSFVKWAYRQARDVDKLRPQDLVYLRKVCRLADARIERATLKRAHDYEQAILAYRLPDCRLPLPDMFQHIIAQCECSKCQKSGGS